MVERAQPAKSKVPSVKSEPGAYKEKFTGTWPQDYQLVRKEEEMKLGFGRCDGEGTGEGAAFCQITCHGDISAMRPRHRAGKTQSQTRTLLRTAVITTEEPVKHAVLIGERNAHARIGNRETTVV